MRSHMIRCHYVSFLSRFLTTYYKPFHKPLDPFRYTLLSLPGHYVCSPPVNRCGSCWLSVAVLPTWHKGGMIRYPGAWLPAKGTPRYNSNRQLAVATPFPIITHNTTTSLTPHPSACHRALSPRCSPGSSSSTKKAKTLSSALSATIVAHASRMSFASRLSAMRLLGARS